jgi:DNA-binding NtrC family response regulator
MPHKILVVADWPGMQDFLLRVLSSAGFEVLDAASNSEAMDVLERFKPGLVITDCLLAGAGPVFLPTIKQFRPKLPVIVLSADPTRAQNLVPDADEIIGTPVSLEELLQTVRRFLPDELEG